MDKSLLPLNVAEQVDRICDHFENSGRAGKKPRIEDYLQAVAEGLREPLLAGLLAVEIELLAEAGRPPDVDAYRRRFATYGDTVERVFREHAWPDSQAASDSRSREHTLSYKEQAGDTLQGPPPATAPTEHPRTIGRFEVLSVLGERAFGTAPSVWRRSASSCNTSATTNIRWTTRGMPPTADRSARVRLNRVASGPRARRAERSSGIDPRNDRPRNDRLTQSRVTVRIYTP